MEKGKHHNRKETMRISSACIVELEGMEFHANHGCLETERVTGNLFTVDFKGEYNFLLAAKSDDLKEAIDYGMIYKVIAQQIEEPANLLETVAARIVNAIAESFPELNRFEVRVSKFAPPVGGACKWSRVTATYPEESLKWRL